MKLTLNATTVEKLMVKIKLSTSLEAYLHLNEMDMEAEVEDEFLQKAKYTAASL